VSERALTGEAGETQVALHLERLGFSILARNARVGRLEIDLIAQKADLLVFCEVRTRRSSAFLDPIETIDRAKVSRIRKAAAQWLALHPQPARQIRFDAASVLLEGATPRLTYYESAF
jgi:putative endonuclease